MLLPYIKQNLEPPGAAPIVPDAGRDGDAASPPQALKNNRRKQALESVKTLEAYLSGVPAKSSKVVKQAKTLTKRLKEYVEAPVVESTDVFDLSRDLEAREIELRQEMVNNEADKAVDYLLILDQLSVFINFLRDDEDAILALLLTE